MYIKKQSIIIISIGVVLAVWLNFYILDSLYLGSFIGFAYLIIFGYLLGELIFHQQKQLHILFFGVFLLMALLITTGTIIYLLVNLFFPWPLIILSIIPLPLLYATKGILISTKHHDPGSSIPLFVAYLVGALMLFLRLQSSATLESVRSPWDLVGETYLVYFFILTLFWVFFLTKNKSSTLTIISSIIHTFLLVAVGVVLFPVGFGYDPFLHEAAQNIILTDGVVLPKTIYYIGHYTFVIFSHYLTLLPISRINTFLVPLTFSIFIPPIAILSLGDYFGKPVQRLPLVPVFLLLLPLTQFTLSNPQAFSSIYLIATLFWWLLYIKEKSLPRLLALFLFIITTATIHPLSGLPLLIWIGILFVSKYLRVHNFINNKRIILMSLMLASSLVIPIIFLANNIFSHTLTTNLRLPAFDELGFTNLWHIDTTLFIPQFHTFTDLLYLYRYNWTLLVLVILLAGTIYIKKHPLLGMQDLSIGFAITWFSSIIVSLFLSFSQLISYEQNDFANRLFLTAIYFLLPFIIIILSLFWSKVSRDAYSKFIFIALLGLIITSVQFISYPRYDSYERIRSFTTSIHDITAVNRVHELSLGRDYVVLANQAVTAAAIQELGFYRYYNNHFFYPVPTGGPLYEYYLSMVYDEPLKEYAEAAAKLTGVSQVYFILNNYWSNADIIRQKAILSADTYEIMAEGKVTIFSYSF